MSHFIPVPPVPSRRRGPWLALLLRSLVPVLLAFAALVPQAGLAVTPPISDDGGDSRAQSVNVSRNGARTTGTPKAAQGSLLSANTATGNKLTTVPLAGWACRGGMSVGFSLYHNSRGDLKEPFAAKWRYSYESYIVFDGSSNAGNATIHWDDGSGVTFTTNGSGFTSPAGEFGTLHYNSNSYVATNSTETVTFTYAYVSKNDMIYGFDPAHGNYLVAIQDRNGNVITIDRQSSYPWNITRITDPTGRQLILNWTPGNHLSTLTDPMSRVWTFNFSATENVNDEVTSTTPNVLLESIGLPAVTLNNGNSQTSFSYAFQYNSKLSGSTEPDGNLTGMVDPNGNTATFGYNDPTVHNALTDVTDPMSNHSSVQYNNQQIIATDPNGNVSYQYYNSSALLDHEVDALGVTVGKYGFDTNFNLSSLSDGRSLLWQYIYSGTAGQNLTSVVNPDARTSTISYTPLNDPQTFTDPLGHTKTIDYQGGNAVGVVDGNLNFWPIYIPQGGYGLPSAVADPFQNTTSFQYDNNGNVNHVQDANGVQHWFTYSALNWLTSDSDVYGNATVYGYDSWGRLINVRKGGSSQVPLYRLDGAPGCVAGGNCSDPLNRILTADPSFMGDLSAGGWTTDGAIGYVFMNSQAAAGLVAMHRLTPTATPGAGQQIFLLDLGGPPPNGTLAYYEQNGWSDQGIVCYVFTQQNAQSSLTPIYWAFNPTSGRYLFTDEYTEYANTIATSPWQGNGALCYIPSQSGSLITTATYAYDQNGNVASALDGNGNGATMTYDADNRLLTRTNTRGRSGPSSQNDTVRYVYDQPNPLTGTTERGLLTATYNGNNGRFFPVYDADNRVTQVNHPDGTWDYYGYDGNSNVAWHEDGNGVKTIFGYDNENRLNEIIHPTNGPGGANPLFASTYSYHFDAAGRMDTSSDLIGQTSYGYDANNNLTTINAPAGSVSYAYYANNELYSKTVPGIGTWTYTYAGLNATVPGNLPSTSVNPYGETTAVWYDFAGRQIGKVFGNGQVAVTAYDDQSRVTGLQYLQDFGSQTPFAEFDYTYDAGGRIVSKLRGADNQLSTYGYDGADQLTQFSVSYHNASPLISESFAYDHNGNRTQRSWNGALDTFYYDGADKLLSVSGGLLGNRTYSYDSAGQPTAMTLNGQPSATFTFDYDGKLVVWDGYSASSGTLSAEDNFRYNGFGALMQKADTTGNYVYITDGVGAGSPVIGDGTSVFSDGNSMRRGNTSTYFAGDLLGSVEDLSGSTGSASHVIEYDPFGVVTAGSQSSLPSVYGYAAAGGAQTNIDSGFLLMGNRFYDPAIGRFLTRDPSGAGDNPYAYCGNNPVSNLDPTGLDPGNVNPSPYGGDGSSQDLSGTFSAAGKWVGKGLHWLGDQLFGVSTGSFHVATSFGNTFGTGAGVIGSAANTAIDHAVDAHTYGLPYIGAFQGDPVGTYGGAALNISTQAALALATDGGSIAVEEASVGQIALGKFNVYTASGYQASLEPFAQNLTSLLGTPVTSFNDWSMSGFSSDSEMILHMMGSADTIHFNMQGVSAAQGLSGAGAVPTAEWELQQVFLRGWAGKTIFYF